MTIYLYVKQHFITGLKYFGKTERLNPYKYMGSGKYWSNHIKTHGNLIETLEVWGFDDQETCTTFALTFSKNNNIVESEEWANLKFENGLDGGGFSISEESRRKMSVAATGRKLSETQKIKISIANTGRKLSEETKKKMCIARKNRITSDETRRKMSIAKMGNKNAKS